MTALKRSTAQILCHADRASHALLCQLPSRSFIPARQPQIPATYALSELITGDHDKARNEVSLPVNRKAQAWLGLQPSLPCTGAKCTTMSLHRVIAA